MKKILLSVILAVAVIVPMTFAEGSSESTEKQFVTLVTGGTGGTYYPVGTIFATLWNKKLGDKGIQSSAQSSGGSVENLSMLKSQEAQLGLSVSGLAADAQKGQNSFSTDAYPDVRLVSGLWPELSQFIVTKASGIKSISDIKGKTFSVGSIGSGTELSTLFLLEIIAGLKPGDYKDQHLGFAESSAAMQNGQLDGMNIEAGIPTAAVSEIAASNTEVTIIGLSQSEFETVKAANSTYGYFTLPGGTYSGVDSDVKTVGVRSVLFTDANVSEELIYTLIKTLYDNFEEIRPSHAALATLSAETALENLPDIKLHPGALRYYEEEGIAIPSQMR